MKHFDISNWADRARGVVPTTVAADMDAHLRSGCTRCQTALAFVQRVAAVARSADNEVPPADAVRWVKAIAALQQPQKPHVLRLIGSLVYDSLREPLAAGMRAEDRASRHVLYEAGGFCLDLRLEHDQDATLATLVGQITQPETPAGQLMDAPVLLTARKNIVAHARCNSFGEFQMEYPPAPHLRLCIAVDSEGGRIELPLDQLDADTPVRSDRGRRK